jgi:hypothetical protein
MEGVEGADGVAAEFGEERAWEVGEGGTLCGVDWASMVGVGAVEVVGASSATCVCRATTVASRAASAVGAPDVEEATGAGVGVADGACKSHDEMSKSAQIAANTPTSRLGTRILHLNSRPMRIPIVSYI